MTCEYNPSLTRHAVYDHPETGKLIATMNGRCTNEATQRLGTENVWHLCDEHAALPIFKRLKKRVRIVRRAA